MTYSKRILVLGGSGFIGGSIVEALKRSNLTNELQYPKREELDILSLSKTKEFVGIYKPDVLIHCAAHIPIDGDFKKSRIINNQLDVNIARAVKETQNCRLIYFSGTSFYKKSNEWLSEESLTETENDYFQSKLDGERIFQEVGLRHVILRVSAPFGVKQRIITVLQKFIQCATENLPIYIYGEGKRVQNFTYICDIISALNCVLIKEETEGIFNICSDNAISMKDLANLVIELTKSKSEIVSLDCQDPDDNTILRISNMKADRILGWKPSYDVRSAISDMIYQKGGCLYKI